MTRTIHDTSPALKGGEGADSIKWNRILKEPFAVGSYDPSAHPTLPHGTRSYPIPGRPEYVRAVGFRSPGFTGEYASGGPCWMATWICALCLRRGTFVPITGSYSWIWRDGSSQELIVHRARATVGSHLRYAHRKETT